MAVSFSSGIQVRSSFSTLWTARKLNRVPDVLNYSSEVNVWIVEVTQFELITLYFVLECRIWSRSSYIRKDLYLYDTVNWNPEGENS